MTARAPGSTQSLGVLNSLRTHLLLVLLIALNFLNFVDRYLLKGFANDVISDLGLTYLQFGLLTGIVFSVFYSTCGLFIGIIADHFNRLKVIAAGAMIWSALTALTGVARGFPDIALARAFIGVGESALTPASLSLIKDIFPPRRLALVTSLYYLGVPLGTGFSVVVAGLLGPSLGWRGTFILLGMAGVVLSLLVLLFREPRRQSGTPSAINFRTSFQALARTLAGSPALRYLILASVLMQFSLGGDVFEQVWLVNERGFDSQSARLIFGSIYLVAATIALILGGLLADWLGARHPQGKLHALLIAALFLVPTLLFRITPPDLPFFYVFAVLSSMFASLTIGPYYSSIQELSPAHMRSTVLAFVLLATTLVGFSLGSAVFGMLTDAFTSWGLAQPLSVAMMVVNGIGLLSIPAVLLAIRHHKGSELPEIAEPLASARGR
ncbi:MFS transporter [Elongatibacter sediminis]|uniref:MFS transporter n=1 Tax=Elongatibacter sediminis TaxID=3119006 RepID=A0AAW9RPS0_9GAMM